MRPPSRLETALIRRVAAVFSRQNRSASLLVLIYHRVLPEPDALLPNEPDAVRFAAQIDVLRGAFNLLPLVEAVQRLRAGTLPARAACITFDDGYANNCEIALPILLAKSVPATVFVATGFLDGGRMFNDTVIETVRHAPESFDLSAFGIGTYSLGSMSARVDVINQLLNRLKFLEPAERLQRIQQLADMTEAALPNNLMLSSLQVQRLHRAGIEIGAHTITHPILTSVEPEYARQQIAASKRVLQELLGSPVVSFAYPNGRPDRDYRAEHVAMARAAGFQLAVSTAWGAATVDSDPFQIPRVAPWDLTPARFGLRLAMAHRNRQFAVA